ncbi:LptA/OstA family protein [Bryobacter aggregatus]|uniref:LptA/OstA family protein n=1 Tax=Bryobacter aggregatus TaxID=360054 RepID=UPI0004E1DFFE|nr:LptA/OstA family protein [Bryobacter aggregatus]
MRRVGPYLLVAVILGIAGYVWYTYQRQMAVQKRNTAAPPQPLPSTLNSKAQEFVYATSEGNRTVAELRAKDYREVKDPAHMELDQMELRLFHEDGKTFDLVKAEKGNYYPNEGRLASDSDVEVQMAVPLPGEESNGKVLGIKAKGASLEIKTGKMFSQGAVEFRFHQEGGEGTGHAMGAEYDPQTHELHLIRASYLRWQPKDPKVEAIEVESDEVRYKELESKVYLMPWSKMRKAKFSMEAAASEVSLQKGVIRHVAAADARGKDLTPKRQVDYAAKTLNVDFSAEGHVEKVIAEDEAKLVTTGESGKTNTTAKRIDLFFLVTQKESLLERALANGKAVVESTPAVKAGAPAGETKVLRSESIEMKMRPGGEEIQRVEVLAPGTLDFLPNRPGQRKRHMEGERMSIVYAANNQLELFKSTNVTTRTEPEITPAKKNGAPTLTWSKELEARFDPKSGEMVRLEQSGDFRYQEGERRAKSDRAVQETAQDRITMTGNARTWDSTGSTDAKEIILNQKTGEFIAIGNVRSIREGEKDAKTGKSGEVTQATAERMEMRDKNTKIHYEGNAVMWQGENRLRAPRIDIDRKLSQLRADGGIVHQMVDEKSAAAKKNGGVILTHVKASEMFYADLEKMVEYRGNVLMDRPGLEVKSHRLRAYLDNDDSEKFNEQPSGGVEKTFAYGDVKIVETGTTRVRKGHGETGEYYTADGKLVLEGGKPEMFDVVKGVEQRRTTGKQLTWFANNDKLIVDGEEKKPAVSNLQRKR